MSRPRDLEELAEVFAALSEPVRLAILAHLAQEPASIADIADSLAIAPGVASKHIARLRRAGIVAVRRAGQKVECRLAREEVLEWCDSLAEESLVRLARASRPDEPAKAGKDKKRKKR
jgi:DNA-binding transcriptional ArsR family regulator